MRGLERRFARAAAGVHRRVGPALKQRDEEAESRVALRCEAALGDVIRQIRPPGYASPALESVLRDGEWAAEELAAIPDTPELRAADEALFAEAHREDDETAVRAEFNQMIERFREGGEPDPLAADLMEILAFCLARVEMAHDATAT
jgi:hypothetical protein